MSSVFIYLIFFAYTLVFAFFVHRFFLKKSRKYNIKKANITAERWAAQNKPISGGITFYVVFLFSIINYFFFFDNNFISNNHFIAIFLVITISFFMGLADDQINTSPYFKFIIQFISGIILIHFDLYIQLFSNDYWNYALTLFWVIGIMNSINMLDNMDAVTSLISISILTAIIANIILLGIPSNRLYFFVSIGILAALFSFLYFNWKPSKMYMGDNGSQFLGAFLASISIIFIWNNTSDANIHNETKQFLAVILVFLVPVIDTTTVTINRLLRKQSPFIGGKDHTTHHLYYLGFSEPIVALLLTAINLLSVSFAVYILNFVKIWSFTYILLFGGYALLMFLMLYVNTKISKKI